MPLSDKLERCSKLRVIDVSGTLAEAIRRTYAFSDDSLPAPCRSLLTATLGTTARASAISSPTFRYSASCFGEWLLHELALSGLETKTYGAGGIVMRMGSIRQCFGKVVSASCQISVYGTFRRNWWDICSGVLKESIEQSINYRFPALPHDVHRPYPHMLARAGKWHGRGDWVLTCSGT